MNKLGMLALACGVALAVVPRAAAQGAQGKGPPIQKKTVQPSTYDELRQAHRQGGGSHRFVVGDETLTTGDLVTITRKGAGKVSGVFVYADPKTQTLFVRPRAGQRPLALPERDIERIERITPATATGGKGGIRPAIEQGDKAAPEGEIDTLTIYNGPRRREFYYGGSSLSPAERNELNALERAGQDVAEKERLLRSLRDAAQNASGYGGTEVVESSNVGYGASYLPAYSYFFPGVFYNPYYYLYYPANPLMSGSYYFGGANQTVVVRDTGSDGRSLAALSRSVSEAETALAAAQKHYAALRQRAVYDAGGNIVAVRLGQ